MDLTAIRPWDDPRQALAELPRAFATRKVVPHVEGWEADGELPRQLHRATAEAGLISVGFAPSVGGDGDLIDSLTVTENFILAGTRRPACVPPCSPTASRCRTWPRPVTRVPAGHLRASDAGRSGSDAPRLSLQLDPGVQHRARGSTPPTAAARRHRRPWRPSPPSQLCAWRSLVPSHPERFSDLVDGRTQRLLWIGNGGKPDHQ